MTHRRARDSIAQKDARYGYNCFWLREKRACLSLVDFVFFVRGAAANRLDK
jgi:hypothetical protein